MAARNKLVVGLMMVPLLTQACYSDHEYAYISLIEDMEVIDYGQTRLRNVRNHTDIPTKYKLEGDDYTLYAMVDTLSIPPALVFTAESETVSEINLIGTSIRCFGMFQAIRPSQVRNDGYPEGGIRFIWQPPQIESCKNAALPTPNDRRLEVTILDGNQVIGVENVRFEIETNGIYREYHSV